jgi:hypothetical protein
LKKTTLFYLRTGVGNYFCPRATLRFFRPDCSQKG